MPFYFISAPCGSGKTYSLIQRACELAGQGRCVLILQPTKELIRKTIEHFLLPRLNHPPYQIFDGDNIKGSVASMLTEYSRGADKAGHIVFSTHQVLPYVRYWADKDQCDVCVDEAPQVLRHNCYEVPNTHKLITDLISMETHNSIYSRVEINKRYQAAMERIAKNKDHDEIYEKFRELSQTLINPHWQSFVNSEHFKKLIDGKNKTLSIHSVLMPSILNGFGSVVMAGANFRDTTVYLLWGQKGIEFQEDKALASKLRFQEHKNGHLITIKYADEKQWSRKRRLTPLKPDNKTTVFDAIVEAAKKEFSGSSFIWQANKRVPNNIFDGKGERLPNLPHGRNDFSKFNNIVFLSSLNPSSDHFRFLKSQGVSGEEVRRALYLAALYQSVMRTSIRDPDNTEPKKIVVPDYTAALYLQGLFPGSRIEKVETTIVDDGLPKKAGRPRWYQSGKDRVSAFRRRRRNAEAIEGLLRLGGPYPLGQKLGEEGEKCNEMGIEDSYTNYVTQHCSATVYMGKKKSTGLERYSYLNYSDVDQFVADLKTWHLRQLESKESNFLISPAIFDPQHPDREGNQQRGLKNIVYLRHIWMDFENGELKPDEIADLFPHLRLIVMNTYNHTPNEPRFRVIFPTNRRLTPLAYKLLWDEIAAKFEDAGYWVDKKKQQIGLRASGLDASPKNPNSLFFAPCEAKNPADSFFIDYNEQSRQLLDPRLWIENNVVPFRVPLIAEDQPFIEQRQVNWVKVEKATDEWRQADHREGDNPRFYQYARKLKWFGMSLPEIERKLRSEVQSANDPIKRRTKIPSIIASLERTWRKTG